MELRELGMTALRATVIYVFLLVVVRLLGKRAIGHSTAFDFMVALLLGEVVDEPIYGDVPLWQALVVIAVIGFWHLVNSYLSYASVTFDRLTGGPPTVLVRDGVPDRRAMAAEKVNEEELSTMLRLQQIDDLADVKVATLEPGGQLSVIKTEAARELQKGDLILGDLLDDLVWGEAPAARGLTALGSLVILHLMVVTLGFWSPRFDRLVGSGATVLIRRGEVLRAGLRREHLNDADLTAALRSAGTPDAGDVREARLEATGRVSVLRRDPVRPADRRDLAGLTAVLRQR